MAELDDISGILNGLFGNGGNSENGENSDGGIDPDTLLKILDIMSKLGENDKYTDLLRALRPLLREDNRRKLDRAEMILKLMSVLPLLGENGLFG
ncbi:MAG: hypothetical protein IJU82_04145 [Ruminiclostridium sp.]|nr:hypothetical protein [Ruminiclostridium sp.]